MDEKNFAAGATKNRRVPPGPSAANATSVRMRYIEPGRETNPSIYERRDRTRISAHDIIRKSHESKLEADDASVCASLQ